MQELESNENEHCRGKLEKGVRRQNTMQCLKKMLWKQKKDNSNTNESNQKERRPISG